ncbi:16S rRNA (cytidine(1402)-2'-O)-methyltransferase [Methylobrevis albus]|uniref:Ribosomal RNA small subunit methyltransferase I n=1 Tax=Methylobrevis albus TaxID=2793297 RepID=A0A931HZL8_9HYPH|nr:16S rRNA (cytidine(1402)-2'-O)-methyltransferase [Methylobrevis albus]MBH0237405.1 16S rRNA (cytidine(1402)-2'-O)-methyltransferase [Methylobrevis albus]
MKDATSAADRHYAIDGRDFTARPIEPALYPVATPIGNLGDVGLRALEVLAAADVIACEDTRVTRVLLDRYGIRRPLVAYHEHNAARERPRLLATLAEGKAVALVSDAGTPLISDPGYKLVEEALDLGHKVIPIPGPSALLAAIVAAGLPTDCFLFGGFLPPRSGQRRTRLAGFADLPATLVFYESPHRAAEALADMADVLGPDRPGALARELTKRFEEVRRGPLAALATGATDDPPRGEIVLLAGPAPERGTDADDLDALLIDALGRMSAGRAAAEVAATTGQPRRLVYARAQALKPLARPGGAAAVEAADSDIATRSAAADETDKDGGGESGDRSRPDGA